MTMKEIQERYDALVAKEQAEAEERERQRIERLEELGRLDMSMEEYICKRTGKTYIPPEELGNLSMEEYIKVRQAHRKY